MTRPALGKFVTTTAIGVLRHRKKKGQRKKIGDENAVLRNVLIHQTQDQGVKAVRAGAGRDNYDQHKGIKRLR